MRTALSVREWSAAGASDVGRVREVNEDRYHVDLARGVFIVVDGVGGQAAGGKAADTAIAMLRERLERETGPVPDRVREAIAIANNEIHRLASRRPEWRGMACVLTVAVADGDRLVVGHVGDTRLYRIDRLGIQKITPDHSPVGEREDAHEISEADAMRHPRRNEVYRDVGSEPHDPADPEFVSLQEVECPDDAAWLLCSDGLTDLLPSDIVRGVVSSHAGDADAVAHALIDAANDAGGKDNVTVVYVEGRQFRSDGWTPPEPTAPSDAATTPQTHRRLGRAVAGLILALFVSVLIWQTGPWIGPAANVGVTGAPATGAIVVRSTDSIAAAIERASPGDDIIVEPGEYRERLALKDNVRVVSRVPRTATLRLPGGAAEGDAAVIAVGVTGAELSGFRIVGDAATPLGIGILARTASVRLVDLEISGAATAAVDLGAGEHVAMIGSDIHDNPGAAVIVRAGGGARLSHNVFSKNATSDRARAAFQIEPAGRPSWWQNVFKDSDPSSVAGIDDAARISMVTDNWFLSVQPPVASVPHPGRASRGR